jgi:hypothetical protein
MALIVSPGLLESPLPSEPPELFHTVCCHDANRAFCGTDVSDLPFSDGTDEQVCVVCHEFEQWADRTGCCPFDQRRCPNG